MHATESFSVGGFASIFDVIDAPVPFFSGNTWEKGMEGHKEGGQQKAEQKQQQPHRTNHKRVLLAIAHPDSTVVYYLLHEGIVKPRQN
jgi:tRNA-splicing endonuclease subunit Sen15